MLNRIYYYFQKIHYPHVFYTIKITFPFPYELNVCWILLSSYPTNVCSVLNVFLAGERQQALEHTVLAVFWEMQVIPLEWRVLWCGLWRRRNRRSSRIPFLILPAQFYLDFASSPIEIPLLAFWELPGLLDKRRPLNLSVSLGYLFKSRRVRNTFL